MFYSALMSLGLIFDGMLSLQVETPCYHFKLVYSLFIVPLITSFLSIMGMAIERFQMFALYRDRRKLTKKFGLVWSMASWILGDIKFVPF